MRLTKKLIAAVVIAGFLATLVMVPLVAEAGGRHWSHGRSHGHHSHGHSSGGYFWGGLAVGTMTGLVVGSLFAPPVVAAPVFVQPAPVFVQPAPVVVQPAPVVVQPVCANHWVPTHWNGIQWVPGYWAQVCR
jgi:hypothetical protein